MPNNEELLSLLISATRVSNAINNNKDLTLLLNNKSEVIEFDELINLDKELRSKPEIKQLLNSKKILNDQLTFNKGKNAKVVAMYESGVKGINEGLNYFVRSLRFDDAEILGLRTALSDVITRLNKCKTFLNLIDYPFTRVAMMEQGTLDFIENNKDVIAGMSPERILGLDKTMYEIRTKLDKIPTTIEELKTFKKEL